MAIHDYNYLYSAYAATFLLKDIISMKHMIDTFCIYIYIYIYFSRLKPFITKSEIADIGVLKWVPSYALYRIKYQYVKNVRYSFLLQQKIEREENFYNIVTDIQQVLKIWEMKRLTLGGKVVILTQ